MAPHRQTGNSGTATTESSTTAEMSNKKAYKNVTVPKSWKLAFNYGLPATVAIGFVLAVLLGYYDVKTFKYTWAWFFRFIKAIFVWEDY